MQLKPRSLAVGASVAASAAIGLCQAAAAATFVPLESTATYLHTYQDSPTPPPALALNLADYGFAAGDRVRLQAVGDVDNGPGGDTFTFSLGVFSSSSELLSNEQRYRVPGALASDGPPVVTAPTYSGGHVTDIDEDFGYDLDGVVVTVPAGANYLFLAKSDQWYHDNSDPDHDFGVLISAAPVPEPASWLLLALGGSVMLGRRRWR